MMLKPSVFETIYVPLLFIVHFLAELVAEPICNRRVLGQIGHVRVDILDGSCELLFIDRIAAHSILLHAILNIGTRTVSPGELEASSDNGLTSVGAGGLNASNTDSGGNVSSAVSASSAIADKLRLGKARYGRSGRSGRCGPRDAGQTIFFARL